VTSSCPLIGLELESLGLLPGEDLPAKVTVGGRLLEDWVLQLQVLHNAAWTKIKVLLDNLHELVPALGAGAVVKHGHRQRLSDSDSVGNLN